jgi:hypothetical protein
VKTRKESHEETKKTKMGNWNFFVKKTGLTQRDKGSKVQRNILEPLNL